MSDLQEVYDAQRRRLKNLPGGAKPTQQISPYFGGNPFEPSSMIPNVPADPALGEPLPSGRFIDPNVPSEANAARMASGQEMMRDTKKYLEENAGQIVNEQSLIDQGKSMLQKVFDYQDDKDAQLFGVNISGVETVWDGFMRYFTGFYDLMSVGYGGLLSAMPGGMRTLSLDELTAGKGIGEVLSGNMDREAAPSPGQIFVASVGEAAGRVRRGEARLSDLLQVSGIIGMSALMADTSPLQEEGFDIMNQQQREKAFSQGWEKWMSGATDFGLAFADPLIGVGVATKVMRAGALGMVGPAKVGARYAAASKLALDEISEKAGLGVDGLMMDAEQFIQQVPTPTTPVVKDLYQGAEVPKPVVALKSFTTADPMPDLQNPLARFLYQVTVRDAETGAKVMPEAEIAERFELKALANRAEVANLLHRADSPVVANLIIGDLMGTPGAREMLERLAPAMADSTYRMRFVELTSKRAADPEKVQKAVNGMKRVKENLERMRDMVIKRIAESTDDPIKGALILKNEVYDTSIRQADALIDAVENGRPIDRMDPQSPFFDMDYTDAVMDDLHRAQDVVTDALNKNLSDSAAQARAMFPMANNPYARMVERSRERRARAGYEYSVEGTNWIPKKVVTTVDEVAGTKQTKWSWWSSSQFQTNRFQRQARVWRWLGSATPSGYISLKGTSLVNQERELGAVLDLDMYRQEPVTVNAIKRDALGNEMYDDAGNAITEEIKVGGITRRNELMEIFTRSLTDETKDPLIAIMDIEQEIMKDFARVYGFSDDQVRRLMGQANRGRDQVLDFVRQRGFFVDPVDGGRHYNAYLDSQLANGTYMHNFQFLETIMRRESLRDGGKRFKEYMDNVGAFTGGIYDTFNSFWRPAVLMRLSYTQRNVFEGMVRAMAFNGSLAPALWPVKASSYGIRNKVVAKRVKKRVAALQVSLDSSQFMGLRRTYDATVMERMRWEQAFESPVPKSLLREGEAEGTVGWFVSSGEGGAASTYGRVDESEIKAALQKAVDDEAQARADLEGNVSMYDAAIDGTEFGTWRREQIDGLTKDIEDMKARQEQLKEFLAQIDAEGKMIGLDDLAKPLLESERLIGLVEMKRARIQYDPIAALGQYQSAAGRAKRIGSGKSIGPDGNYHNNAFEGPWEQISRANMSSDATVMQSLSLHADLMGSLWRRVALRTNAAIPYVALKPEPWINGMRGVIEMNTSSALVRYMILNDYDLDKTYNWLIGSEEGRRWFAQYSTLQGSEGPQVVNLNTAAELWYGETSARGKVAGSERKLRVAGKEEQLRLKRQSKGGRAPKIGEVEETLTGARLTTFQDVDQVKQFLMEVKETVLEQTQRRPEFMDLLRARAEQKQKMPVIETENVPTTSVGALTNDQVRIALDSIPEEARNKLGYVQGSELIEMGAAAPMRVWANFTARAFKFLGTIPEDAVTRGPFYAGRYKAARDDMIEMYLIRTGQADKIRRGKRQAAPGGREHGGTIQQDEFQIPAGEFSRIEYQAHRRALADTREWMYTIERRTKLGKYGEWLYPFISATQNSVTVAGKLLYRQPWLAPFIYDIWRAPSRAGFEDENGNLMLPMPVPWVREFLKDKEGIPGIGGILSDDDMLTIPKEALNLWTPETGFGVVPRPAPWAQVAASELMKANMFPVETPAILRNALGDKEGDEFYQSFKQWIFGEEGGASGKILSWDKLFPAYAQKVIYSRDELSAQYGYQYSLQWATQMYRFRNGDRDKPPTEQELNQRVTNAMWFQALGNFGMPTPLTPYPILSRPIVKTPIEAIQDQYRLYQQVDPKNAAANFYTDYGDLAVMAANTKITRNVGGIDPVPESVSDAQTLAPLLSRVANNVSNLEVLGLLVNNRSSNVAYEDSSYEWQKTARIPGTNVEWRQVQAPAQSVAERQRIAGWVEYRKFMDQLDAQLAAAGLPNYNVAAARPYKAAKDVFIANMENNPERDGWAMDYQNRGAPKAIDAVRAMQIALQDEGFIKLIGQHDPQLLGAMGQYLQYRDMTLGLVQQSGKSFNDVVNADIKDAWLTIRQNLSAHPRFGEILSMYLYGDENPVDVGPIGTSRYVEVASV